MIGETKGLRSICDEAYPDYDWICCLTDYFTIDHCTVTCITLIQAVCCRQREDTMPPGAKEVSQIGSFPEVCNACVSGEKSYLYWDFRTSLEAFSIGKYNF